MARDIIDGNTSNIKEVYPDLKYLRGIDNYLLLNIKSITYNVYFRFFPYDMKITENLTPEWNKENVIGRMDPISTFKRMGRSMTITFKAKARYGDKYFNANDPTAKDPAGFLPADELLHAVDHMKRTLYPRYDKDQVMTSPPLFRIKYGNLIHAGEKTMGADKDGVLCNIDSFSANPIFGPNAVTVKYAKGNLEIDSNTVGNKSIGFYPNGFDISLGFTVFNENLAETSQGILQNKYFYDYVESIHKTNTEPTNIFDSNNTKTLEEQQASEQEITKETGS